MGHIKRQDKVAKQKAFVSTPWKLLNSKAYLELPPSAAKALPYFLGRLHTSYEDLQYYRTVFSFSYPEARRLGFASATWVKVLRDLVEYGFIDPVSKGGLRGNGKSCAQFRLSDRWKEYGEKNFVQINLKTWGT